MPKFGLDAVRLSRAVETLEKAYGLEIVVAWGDLADAGVQPSTPVRLPAQDYRGHKTLKKLIEAISTGQATFTYAVDEAGVVHVIRAGQEKQWAVTRRYDVRDILAAPHYRRRDRDDGFTSRPTADNLVTLIPECVSPDSWSDGGGWATIELKDGQLTVRQTRRSHAHVEMLLEQLREAMQRDGYVEW